MRNATTTCAEHRATIFAYSVPLGYWTGTLSASEYMYHQRIMGAVQSFVYSGKMQNMEAKINYLFHRNQFSKTSLQFRTAKFISHAYVDNTEVMVQKRDITFAEIALLHKHNIGQGQIDTTLAYQQGVPWFGAQIDPAGLSATSPHNLYSLETLDVTLNVPFRLNERLFSFSSTFSAQNSNSALYATQWFAIGNRWTVRGFDGEYPMNAEKGFFLRNELSIPITGTAQSAYVGLDFGKVYGDNTATLLGNKLAGIRDRTQGKSDAGRDV